MKDDAALVAEALTPDAEQFGPIADRYRDAVFGIALARTGNFHDAEDVAQEVFVEAFQRLGALSNPERLGPWLRSITIHRCIDSLRRRYRKLAAEHVAGKTPAKLKARVETGRQDLRERVLAAIGQLSEAQRETTALFYVDGYSLEEVARIQEVPVGTVKRRLHDARKKLQEDLMDMAEHILKAGAPKEDFTVRVMSLLTRFSGLAAEPGELTIGWRELYAAFREIGLRGITGISKALQSSHAPTRVIAAHMALYLGRTRLEGCSGQEKQAKETLIDLLEKATADANKKLRKFAISLLNLDVNDDRKRRDFVPLIVPLLRDPSIRVRRSTASELRPWASEVPLDTAARAFLAETDPYARGCMEQLLRAILEAQDGA